MTSIDPGLTRSFFDLPTNTQNEAEEFSFLHGLPSGRDLTWDQLLQADRVLIVSEAGAGKTYECKQQQARLWRAGESAFYLELAVVTSDSLESQFGPKERERFGSWKDAQTERAYFFLDSIDELKLTSISFELTLKRFATALGDHLGRACIVLTTRPGADDREVVRRQLPIPEVPQVFVPEEVFADAAMRVKPPEAAEDDARWRFVALASLDEEQMHRLATLEGVSDPDKLMAAIEAEHAEEFAKRPLDFIELCGDWKAHSRIRGHREQLESSIGIKLRPRSERKEMAELSPLMAREGVERLALAALMMRKFTLWHGNEADRGRGDGALDPRAVLSNWSQLEVRTLLERALFGFATYGRVRFHNRSVTEYLAAQRLRELVKRGLSLRTLHRLLFINAPVGLALIRPTMQPVAAWLAASLEPVRAEVLKRDPSVMLRFGDPGALDISLRAQALTRYVAVYGEGGWRGLHVPALQCRRLAEPALATTIQQLWAAGVENQEARETLLDLIEAGRIGTCADIAFEVAVSADHDARERLTALQALAATDDSRLPELLDKLASQHADWPGELAAAAVVHLFPAKMSVGQLLGALRGIRYNRREFGGVSRYLPDAIVGADLLPASLETMRHGLTGLMTADCEWDTAAYRFRSGRGDLVGALSRVCELQLRDRAPEYPLGESIALALQLSQEDGYNDDQSEQLRIMLAMAPTALRSAVFWAQDRLLTHKMPGKDASARWFRMMSSPSLALDAARDRAWLQADLGNATCSIDQRRMVLECVIQLAQETADRLVTLKATRPFVSDAPGVAARLEEMVDAFENPSPPPKWVAEQARRSEERSREEQKNRASWIQFWRELTSDADKPFDAKRLAHTARNLSAVMSRAPNDERYSGWNRGFLERVFDKPMVERLRTDMMSTWRLVQPTLPSERPEEERNCYYSSWRVGLTGLYAEAEDPQWARRLNAADAQLAMRYAIMALTGLPDWVDALAQAHPDVVRDMLRPELELQLGDTGPHAQHSSLLQYIAHAGPRVIPLFVDALRDWVTRTLTIDAAGMCQSNKFERSIELLLEHGTATDAALVQSAAQRTMRANRAPEQVLFWLPLLMRLAPAEAVAEMERLAVDVEPAARSVVTQWFATLFGHSAHRSGVTTALLKSPALLSRLTFLAYRHIRLADDRPRQVKDSSEARDDAEFARSQLLSALLNVKGAEAWHAKLKFAENPLVAHFRDRAVALANQGMAEEWDAPLYELADVECLESELDIAPVTRADMAALLLDRLAELDDRLRQDSSPRELWSRITDERILRRAVAGELERLANGAYNVDQEAVTGGEKETDLRLRSSSQPMEAVIELKVGENGYSVADFSRALRHQLVAKYMAPEARRVGCLMISIASDKRWKHPVDSHLIGIEEVIALLQDEANQIVSGLGFESLLEVRALDLRLVSTQ